MVWKARNEIIFKYIEFHKQNLMQGILFNAWCWLKSTDEIFFYSFAQLSLNPGACILGL